MDYLIGILSGLTASVILFALGRLVGIVRFTRTIRLPKSDAVKEMTETLNRVFDTKAKIDSIKLLEPTLEHIGDLIVEKAQMREISKIRTELPKNQIHALVDDQSHLDGDPARIAFRTCDYATIRSMRLKGLKPKVISSGAVVVCSERKSVLIHHRSQTAVDTGKGRLHIFGGSYMHETLSMGGDRLSLRTTATRELFEETGIFAEIPSKYPALLSWETPTGFFQVIHLGVDFPASRLPKVHGDPEGSVIETPFDELEHFRLGLTRLGIPFSREA
jgi:8-oxo-dGTP pyrophosphatase MutT (NUDIX family)